MRLLAVFLLFLFSINSNADEREIQRALMQRDQQSAEFAQRGSEARRALETLHSNQQRDLGVALSPDPALARGQLIYERQTMAREREMFPPINQPAKLEPPAKALPLPGSGGPPGVVVPISTPSIGG